MPWTEDPPSPTWVKSQPWQEAQRVLRLGASAWLPVHSSLPKPQWNLTVALLCIETICPVAKISLFTHTWALGQVLTPRPLQEKGYMFAQHTGDSGKKRRIRPAMIYADPLTHIKTASLPAFPHWTAMKIKGETPPIKSQGLKVIAVESRPQKGTLRIQQPAQPHQLENQLRHAWRQLTRDLLCGGWSGEVWRICRFPLWSLMKHTFWLMVARGVASAVTGS